MSSRLRVYAVYIAMMGCVACGPGVASNQGIGFAAGSTGSGTTAGTTPPVSTTSSNSGGTSGGGGTNTPPAGHVTGNPFAGAAMYINPDYTRNTDQSLAGVAAGSADAQLIAKARNLPTAVWLDSLAALAGGARNSGRLSLQQHLDAAVAQAQAANQAVVVALVVYDLPDRDCAASASNGELQGSSGLATYKSQYIDVIAQTLTAKPAYQNLRFVLIIEPDSLPNMVTNTSLPNCAVVASSNLYVDGITYAIRKLGSVTNAYIYMDIAHSAWLGWPANMSKAVAFYKQVVAGVNNGDLSVIRGFATNISNYIPLREPFVSPSNTSLLNGPFYQNNPVFDELTYIDNLDTQMRAAGFTNLGFIIDTSRNGWAQVNNGAPIDHRKARGNWCNVAGAGLGERPRVGSAVDSRLDAFVYVKPPGESDGASAADSQGHGYDPSCDPSNPAVDAMPGAPHAGAWFDAQFMMLLHNATPPL